jgi:hypothetical protein
MEEICFMDLKTMGFGLMLLELLLWQMEKHAIVDKPLLLDISIMESPHGKDLNLLWEPMDRLAKQS